MSYAQVARAPHAQCKHATYCVEHYLDPRERDCTQDWTIEVSSAPADDPTAVDDKGVTTLPWRYKAAAFLDWVEEVFLESYKRTIDPITLAAALDLLQTRGYTVSIQ